MNIFEKVLYSLQIEMQEPKAFGWFHLLWVGLVIIALLILYRRKNKTSDKQLKIVLGVYGIIALILELIKQLIWSFNYDNIANVVTWDYQWYSAPFQLCTTPIYVSIICLFLKNNKLRESLLSYIAFVTILGSITTILMPDSCLVNDMLVNIHTMWLHCGSFVLSVYLLFSGSVQINKQNLKKAFIVFIAFVCIAEVFNIFIYNTELLKGETFNMFYISPYFTSTLPVFNIIQESVPFIIFLLIYLLAIIMGSTLIYTICYLIESKIKRKISSLNKDINSQEIKEELRL